MKRTILAVAVAMSLISGVASADGIALRHSTAPVCDPPTYDHILFRVPPLAPCAPTTGITVNFTDRGLEFEHGATVDFADYTMHDPGPLRGYVYVKVQGDWYLMPYYNLR